MADNREPEQETQPKGKDEDGQPAKPITIPVPKRSAFDKLLGKAEKPSKKPAEKPASRLEQLVQANRNPAHAEGESKEGLTGWPAEQEGHEQPPRRPS